jgi:hypothetical protein
MGDDGPQDGRGVVRQRQDPPRRSEGDRGGEKPSELDMRRLERHRVNGYGFELSGLVLSSS